MQMSRMDSIYSDDFPFILLTTSRCLSKNISWPNFCFSIIYSQVTLNKIASWTEENQMKLNEEKTNYMIFSRSQSEFATRLSVNGKTLDRVEAAKVVGVWLTTWLDWERNTTERSCCILSSCPQLRINLLREWLSGANLVQRWP